MPHEHSQRSYVTWVRGSVSIPIRLPVMPSHSEHSSGMNVICPSWGPRRRATAYAFVVVVWPHPAAHRQWSTLPLMVEPDRPCSTISHPQCCGTALTA